MAEDGRFRVKRFNNQNYQLWKMQMEDCMYQRDLYQPLNGKAKKLMNMTDTEWDILDRKALGTIQLRLAAELSSVGVTFDDEVRALLFLCSLPEIWNGLVMAISNSAFGSSTLKFDDVVDAILSKEMQHKRSSDTLGNALTAETRRRKMETGKSAGYRSKSRKGRYKSRSGIVCWKCGNKGHLKKDYKSRKGKE
eukprot:PITA_30120